jgi:A/G-specific adenine glycosylase
LSAKEAWDLAEELLAPKRPGDFNQAMMELGATVCLPGQPNCLICPVMKYCSTRGAYPRGEKEERKTRTVAFGFSQRNGSVWLVQRSKSLTLMPGMWELPEIESNGHPALAKFKHSILDTDFAVSVFALDSPSGKGCWVKQTRLPSIGLTGLARKILRHFAVL